jgi:hypothetical protein
MLMLDMLDAGHHGPAALDLLSWIAGAGGAEWVVNFTGLA